MALSLKKWNEIVIGFAPCSGDHKNYSIFLGLKSKIGGPSKITLYILWGKGKVTVKKGNGTVAENSYFNLHIISTNSINILVSY